jgi:hypothetical protein
MSRQAGGLRFDVAEAKAMPSRPHGLPADAEGPDAAGSPSGRLGRCRGVSWT